MKIFGVPVKHIAVYSQTIAYMNEVMMNDNRMRMTIR